MPKNVIIIISGAPATGKTTLGKKLSAKYNIPFISKDALKERIFDNLGWSDKAWSLKVSAASHRIMDYFIAEELKAGHSVIVESNFKQHIDSGRFHKFQTEFGCELVQIFCWAEGEVIFKRFMDRIGTTKRHAGQVEAISADEIRRGFIESGGRDTPLDIERTIELNTTDFNTIKYEPIYRAIKEAGASDGLANASTSA